MPFSYRDTFCFLKFHIIPDRFLGINPRAPVLSNLCFKLSAVSNWIFRVNLLVKLSGRDIFMLQVVWRDKLTIFLGRNFKNRLCWPFYNIYVSSLINDWCWRWIFPICYSSYHCTTFWWLHLWCMQLPSLLSVRFHWNSQSN
jgi:hypothetical protein